MAKIAGIGGIDDKIGQPLIDTPKFYATRAWTGFPYGCWADLERD